MTKFVECVAEVLEIGGSPKILYRPIWRVCTLYLIGVFRGFQGVEILFNILFM